MRKRLRFGSLFRAFVCVLVPFQRAWNLRLSAFTHVCLRSLAFAKPPFVRPVRRPDQSEGFFFFPWKFPIVSWTLSGMFLVGPLDSLRKRRTSRKDTSAKSPRKPGKSRKQIADGQAQIGGVPLKHPSSTGSWNKDKNLRETAIEREREQWDYWRGWTIVLCSTFPLHPPSRNRSKAQTSKDPHPSRDFLALSLWNEGHEPEWQTIQDIRGILGRNTGVSSFYLPNAMSNTLSSIFWREGMGGQGIPLLGLSLLDQCWSLFGLLVMDSWV